MKPIDEWDEEYVLNLPPGEHDWVEFKGARSLDFSIPNVKIDNVIDELSKQLSAFANSGGGTIVYGIKDSPSIPREIDNGGVSLNLKNRSTKEWLEDIIPNIVEYLLTDFNLYVIIKSNISSKITEDKGIILISISDSDKAPHQARDKKYYARVGGKSRPIGHRLVMDIVGRSQNPKMKLLFWFEKDEEEKIVSLYLFCQNSGKVYAQYVNGFLYLPANIRSNKDDEKESLNNVEYSGIYFSNIHKDLVNYKGGMASIPLPGSGGIQGFAGRPYYITRYDPVLPGLGFTKIFELNSGLGMDDLKNYKEDKIYWSIYADNSGILSGDIKIGDILDRKGV